MRYDVDLSIEPTQSFRCQKAANSLDIDVNEKLRHQFSVDADLDTEYNVGVIVGSSGSGKTTLAASIWGDGALARSLDPDVPVIDQFPDSMDYKSCVKLLTGVGLTQVPCWIRPAWTLSNGQKERAEIALKMATAGDFCVVDEWTSVVDRTVAKVMSHCIAKWARATNRRVVLLTCHFDVLEWLQPDWVIDCNQQQYVDRRSVRPGRTERLSFDIRECHRAAWRGFSQYHYLSSKLPGGHIETFGLFHGDDQIGFQCFANYTPHRPGTVKIMHSNRTVIHPDYVGLGLGMTFINETSFIMADRGYDVRAKFSSAPVFAAMSRDPNWTFLTKVRPHKMISGDTMERKGGFRLDVTVYSFKFNGTTRTKTETAQSASGAG